MLYFKYLGLVGGVVMVLSCLGHLIFSSKHPNLLIDKLLPEKRPSWLWVAAILMAGLTFYTWFRFASYANAFSLLVGLFITSGFAKTIFFVVSYAPMRTLSIALITKEKTAFHIILACFLVMGLGLFYVGMILS